MTAMKNGKRGFREEYFFLSNFYPLAHHLMDKFAITYSTVEHAYQAAKTDVRGEREMIASALTPGDAKRWGKKVTIRPDWSKIKLVVMKDLLKRKFKDVTLKDRLVKTGDEELIEWNTWGDEFWGKNITTGKGDNHLGVLLMELRQSVAMSTHEKRQIVKMQEQADDIMEKQDPFWHYKGGG